MESKVIVITGAGGVLCGNFAKELAKDGHKVALLDINIDELSSGVYTEDTVYDFSGTVPEKAEKAVNMVENELSEFNIVIRLSGNSCSMMDFVEARDSLVNKGYDSFILG